MALFIGFWAFGSINIIPYLDFSEIILSIFSDLKVLWRLLVMLTGNLFLVPLIWWLVSYTEEKFKKGKGSLNPRIERVDGSRMKRLIIRITSPNNSRARIWLAIVGVLFIASGAFKFLSGWATSIDDRTFYISSVALSFGLFTVIRATIDHFYISAILASIILFFFIFILLGKHGPTLDKQNGLNERWTILTATDTIQTSDSVYLAGRTNHYYFIYDEKDRTTSIIPVSEIKRAQVKSFKRETNRLRDLLKNEFNRIRGN